MNGGVYMPKREEMENWKMNGGDYLHRREEKRKKGNSETFACIWGHAHTHAPQPHILLNGGDYALVHMDGRVPSQSEVLGLLKVLSQAKSIGSTSLLVDDSIFACGNQVCLCTDKICKQSWNTFLVDATFMHFVISFSYFDCCCRGSSLAFLESFSFV